MASRRLLVSGRVQGVFYRSWTEANARALNLTGWVRNLATGEVEIVATGPDEAVEELIRRCRVGPPRAAVSNVAVEDADEAPTPGFTVRRST